MTVGEAIRLAHEGRVEALATRDPIAIKLAHGRWDVVTQALAGMPEDEVIDPDKVAVGIKLASQALGYTPQQTRRLIRERKMTAYKENDQWRIPLSALL